VGIDYLDRSKKLRVRDIWKAGNGSGVVTDPRLYDPDLGEVFRWRGAVGGVLHVTVDADDVGSMKYLAGGSLLDGRNVSAHYHFPDDELTVNKMVPDGTAPNHCGQSSWPTIPSPLNSRMYGFEVRNRGNWSQPVSDDQLVKVALVWAYLSSLEMKNTGKGLLNINLLSHSAIATYGEGDRAQGHRPGDRGRRSDPEAGLFDYARFYEHLSIIRGDERVFEFWGLPVWGGRG
jgi:N-acetyl-anhydromuramyl-L-alanine amidase AmpD